MTRTSFNEAWAVGPNVSVFSEITGGATTAESVTLPHDAMLTLPRNADADSGPSTGYFAGGAVSYRKEFDAPLEWGDRVVELEFEGVYRDAMIYLNGVLVGQRPNGYSPFTVRLDPALRLGETNRIRVDARAHRDSRWYSGLGIYRDVWLHVSPLVHVPVDGVAVTTPDVDEEQAVVAIAVEVTNAGRLPATRTVDVCVRDPDGAEVARGETVITVRGAETAVARVRLYVDDPQLWSPDTPHLYTTRVTMGSERDESDSRSVRFGIRTLQLDPRHGLRINGMTTKLRGACIHHDNGVLGAVAVAEAELRRVRTLKAAGFNAIRMSHNTAGRQLLEACDDVGLLVVDEAFDMWTEGKQPFDYSLSFSEWWDRDITAMVRKDRNHPSVVMYSIGNEILDAGKPLGAAIGRDLAERVRQLDPTRFLTNGISGFVATLTDTVPGIQRELEGVPGGINDVQGVGKALLDRVSRSDFVTAATAESHGVVDVAGHNYAEWRYEAERERFPNRVVLGTETNPQDIARNWSLVGQMPWVLGDFTWTGWDYLGEAGLGAVSYPEDGETWNADSFPALLAFCGDIDITGFRRPASYFREIVFGLRSAPYIAVHRPRPGGRSPQALGWAWTDSVSHWTWNVEEGAELTVDVYSDAAIVRLELNGRTVGEAPAGPDRGFTATFTVPYAPGELRAVAVRDGSPTEYEALSTVRAATNVRLTVEESDETLGDPRFVYVIVELVDDEGRVIPNADRVVELGAEGPVRLAGFGSARPVTMESYRSDTCTTYLGRALAVVRRDGEGRGILTAKSSGLELANVII